MYTHIKQRAKKLLASVQILALSLTAVLPAIAPQTANAAPPTIAYDTSNFEFVGTTGKVYLNSFQLLDIGVNFTEATNNTVIKIQVPKRLTIGSTSVSTNGGNSIVETTTTTDTGTTPDDYTILSYAIKDGTIGNYHILTQVRFDYRTAYTNQTETITTSIEEGASTVATATQDISSLVKSRITLVSNHPGATLFADDTPTTFYTSYSVQGKRDELGEDWRYIAQGAIDSTYLQYQTAEMRIQLPTNATYIDGDYTYDATTHSIFRTATPFFTNGSSVRKFTIKFNGMQNGDPIIEPSEVVISAIESDGTSKVFTGAINWNGATISTPTRRVTENGYNPKGSLVKGQENQTLLCTQFANKGTLDVNNFGVEYTFPDGIQAHSFRLQEEFYFNTQGNISLKYTTNNGDTRTVPLPNFSTYYDRNALGLLSGEYMQSATIQIDTLAIGDDIFFGPSLFRRACFFGDVSSMPDETASMSVKVLEGINEITSLARDIATNYRDISNVAMYIYTNANKTTINPGEIVQVNSSIYIDNYYYVNNGEYAENPTIFMFVPEGFNPLTGSLQVQNADSHGPFQYVSTQSGMQIYKITTQKQFYKHSRFVPDGYNNVPIKVKIDLQSDITINEGSYDFFKIFTAASEDNAFRFISWGGADVVSDSWGLLSTDYKGIATAKRVYLHRYVDSVTVNKSNFNIQDFIQSTLDTSPVGTYVSSEDNSSKYQSNTTANITTALYNAQDTDVSNFVYDIALPYNGDSNGSGSEWTAEMTGLATLTSVSGALAPGATVLYSYDGVAFGSLPTNLANVRYIRLSLPTFPSKALYNLSVPVKAPDMSGSNDYQQTAWLKTNYNTGGDTYEIGVKKLYLSDAVAPIGTITYSPDNTTPTNSGVVVQMETSEPIEIPAGWIRIDDTHYTLIMSDNGTGSLEIVDNSGNTGSVSYSVANIDTVAPVVTLHTPSAITSNNESNYTISGTCTPGDLDVEVSVNGIPQINTSTPCSGTGTYTLTLDLSNLPEGDTTVEVTQRDLAGNVSDTVTATLYKDSIPPNSGGGSGTGSTGSGSTGSGSTGSGTTPLGPLSAPNLINASDTGISHIDNITTDSTPTFEVYCSETGSTIILYSDFPNNETELARHNCTTVGVVEITVTAPMDNATHTITYTETDSHGNTSEHSDPLDIVIDTLDTDGDGEPDATDTDDDNDGVSDSDEIAAGLDPKNPDSDGDGVSDGDEDADGDGISNADESDETLDTITDTDGDGTPDLLDTDSDGDGHSDADEVAAGTNPRDPNSFPYIPPKSNTGPGGGYDPNREEDTPHTGSILQDVWNTTMGVNVIKNTPALTEQAKEVQSSLLDSYCPALITDIDELKTKALYYQLFIHNRSDEYVNQYIRFGQFKRVLIKYESLLNTTPTQEQSIGTILKTINKAMNDTVERGIAIKVFMSYLQKRYQNNNLVSHVPENTEITTFADNNPQTAFAPQIQKAYDLCLIHGRNTRDGVPLNQTTGQKDPDAPRLFEPRENITIAETIKILINMSHSWDKIEALTND